MVRDEGIVLAGGDHAVPRNRQAREGELHPEDVCHETADHRHGHAGEHVLHGDDLVVRGPDVLQDALGPVMSVIVVGMAVGQIDRRFNHFGPLTRLWRVGRHPVRVLARIFHDHRGRHDSVAESADLGALYVEGPGGRGLEPTGDASARNRILLQAPRGHRKAVQHVHGFELEVVGLAVLHVELVDREDVVRRVQGSVGPGVLERPCPLLSDDPDFFVRRGEVHLDLVPHPEGRDHDDDVEDQNGKVGVGHPLLLVLLLPRDVLGLLSVLRPELEDEAEEDPLGQDEPEPDRQEDDEHQPVETGGVGRALRDDEVDHVLSVT